MNYLPLILLTLLAVFGISIEMNPAAKTWQLFTGLHLAGLGTMVCLLRILRKKSPALRLAGTKNLHSVPLPRFAAMEIFLLR
jgi:hypothetical protein